MTQITFDFTSIQEKQKEALRLSKTVPVLFYGGAKGGGKSYLVRVKEIARRLKYPGTKGLIIRKTYPELLSNHIRKMFEEHPQVRPWFNKGEKVINWPNGSVTEFSYLQTADDVFTYQGREYEDITVDEVTQHDEIVYKILRTSLRTTRKDIKPSMLLTGNPGGPGHAWVKRLFIDRRFQNGEKPEEYGFLQAKVWDNNALMEADPEYIKRLEALPDHLRKAYLDGDWNIFAGQAFSELSESVHFVAPFQLPENTRYIAGFDYGYNHPFSLVLLAIVPDGTVYVTKHVTGRLMTPNTIIEKVRESGVPQGIPVFAGHDIWNADRTGGASLSEQLRGLGQIIKAKTDRVQGVAQIRKFISWRDKPNQKPGLYFFKTPEVIDLYNIVSGMQFDNKKPEDVVKVDADEHGMGGDDPYDAFRYALMSRANPNLPQKDTRPDQTAQWIREFQEQQQYRNAVRGWR